MEGHRLQVASNELASEAARARYIARELPDRWAESAEPAALKEVRLEDDFLDVLKLNRHGEIRSAIALLTAIIAELADRRLMSTRAAAKRAGTATCD